MSLAQIKQDYVTPNPNDQQAQIKAYLQDLIDNKLENLPTGSDEVSVLIQTLAGKMQTRVGREMSRCVNLSIEVNETAIFSAKMLNDIRDVDHQTQSIAVAAEEMVATVKEIETTAPISPRKLLKLKAQPNLALRPCTTRRPIWAKLPKP